ncbi:glycine zipper 2TM domain-containing protein [Shewanella eurypsychrophilus]|uniref:Glycine zipper 2TM domain-containing protein n=1 Tax=Shewanella eurypsychrophilus TaxID=2593656 RepID=A0ABX6V701_9GAMM|nr:MULTISPECIES: glycine zipper 2TM domain-containing protein [Shewanella]QFU23119.1 glycine zipper 2TM domain-containing protein [Shewanella sp. YLB-09]QPG58402.1 glycine zipper 2TM domain-containing protein [Shewanella eurypsychrophilus]
MLKPSFALLLSLSIALAASFHVSAAYERNQAVPVEKVIYASVTSVRNITEKQLVEDRNTGWKTFGGALLGGVIGHQFGGGSGQDVATVLGALIGAGVGNRYGDSSYYQELRLVELMVTQEGGEQVMIIQDLDPGMIFNPGDEVRVVYLQGSVRVDIAM